MKYQKIYHRLRRIEGQIRGLQEMLERNRSEEEILVQLEAAKSSLGSTITALIEAMTEPGIDGKSTLSPTQLRAVLRSLRKA